MVSSAPHKYTNWLSTSVTNNHTPTDTYRVPKNVRHMSANYY